MFTVFGIKKNPRTAGEPFGVTNNFWEGLCLSLGNPYNTARMICSFSEREVVSYTGDAQYISQFIERQLF